MISGEYGKRLYLDVNFDVSGYAGSDGLQIEVMRPDDSALVFNVSAGVTLGAVDATVTDEQGATFNLAANRYVYRDWQDGEINQPGSYRVRAVYQDGTKRLRSRPVCFSVSP
jgi:hypothetical protein